MKKIPLTQGQFTLVDDEDFEELNKHKWCASRDYKTFYATRMVRKDGKDGYLKMHRVIMNTPKGMLTDHKDGNGINNQRHNLRICTRSQNQQNRGKTNRCKSGFKGVSRLKNDKKWASRISHQGVAYNLGRFTSKIEAARAYDKKAKELFGEFAWLNFKETEGE